MAMELRKYYACYKLHDSSTPFTLTIHAPDIGHAVDKMVAYCGVTRVHDDDEYDLFEIVDENKYVPVAQKFKKNGTRTPPKTPTKEPVVEVETTRSFKERKYVSYRDVA